MPKKLLLSIAAVVAAVTLAACGADEDESAADTTEQSQQEEQAMPEPELDNIPDVVATVNDTEISGETFAQNYETQFQQLLMQAQMTGETPDQDAMKVQALDMMINTELLVSEAEAQGFSASDADIDEYLSTLAQDNGLESTDALMEEFEAQGLSADRVREDLTKEVLIDQVIDGLDISAPTDEAVQELYDQQVEQVEAMNEQVEEDQQQEVPAFEDLEEQLVQQLTMQQENEAVSELLDELRADAAIETHI